MIQNLKELLSPRAVKTVSLTITRNCSVGGRHYSEGDTASFSEAIAAELLAQGCAADPAEEAAAVARKAVLDELLPPPGEMKPMPELWKYLPKVFRQWWELNEKGLLLVHRAAEIEERLMERVTKFTFASDVTSINRMSASRQKDILLSGLGRALQIGEIPKQDENEVRFLKDANHRASQALKDWREVNEPELMRLKILCGDELRECHSELARTITGLHDVGFEIFKARIAALGLGDHKAKELFHGSADAVRFNNVNKPTLGNLKVGWPISGGETRMYLEMAPQSMAQI